MVSVILGGISLVAFGLALFLHYIGCGKTSESDQATDFSQNGKMESDLNNR